MKTRILIVGIGMMIFGFAHLLSYLPISFPLLNTPFPFEHIQLIFRDDGGITRQIGYMPFDEATFHPYWLLWSLVLYAGIVVTGFGIWKKRK